MASPFNLSHCPIPLSRSTTGSGISPLAVGPTSTAVPADYQATASPLPPAGTGDLQRSTSTAPEKAAVGASEFQGATFLMIQERLRDMGAVSYRLETWGSRGQLYRFECEMSVNGSTTLKRHFEATASHPLLAMHKVLEEAERWQASR